MSTDPGYATPERVYRDRIVDAEVPTEGVDKSSPPRAKGQLRTRPDREGGSVG